MVRDVRVPSWNKEPTVRDVRVPSWNKEPAVVIKKVHIPWSKEQVADLFNSVDVDRDGKLSKEELKAAFKKLGSRWSSFRAGRALHHADANHDGLISKEELQDLVNYALERGYKL